MKVELTEQEVKYLIEILHDQMADGIPMDKLDQYEAGTYIDPAESIIKKLEQARSKSHGWQDRLEESEIEKVNQAIAEFLDGHASYESWCNNFIPVLANLGLTAAEIEEIYFDIAGSDG